MAFLNGQFEMLLNYLWLALFFIAIAVALIKWVFLGDSTILPAMQTALFDMSKTGFELSLNTAGLMTFWLGIMKIGEAGGMINFLTRITAPFFSKLFPEVPQDHPAFGTILMNFSANMLGLDNAATPIGLKAMKELQEINPNPDTASNAMIMFTAINTAGLTLLPVSIMAYRLQAGAANPADILIPSILGTFISAFTAMILVGLKQRLNLLSFPVIGTLTVFIGLLVWLATAFSQMEQTVVESITRVAGSIVIFGFLLVFMIKAMLSKISVYDAFIDGAKEGFTTAVRIIPYLIAMLVAIGVFRASGALDYILQGITYVVEVVGGDTQFIPALPTGLLKPFSGSGARGLMLETMQNLGADSFAGRTACIIQGSTETTFYVLAVYYGSVQVKRTRYSAGVGLIVDLVGVIAGIWLAYLFFI